MATNQVEQMGTKTGPTVKTGDRFFQRSDQSEGLVDRFSYRQKTGAGINTKALRFYYYLLVFGVYSGPDFSRFSDQNWP